MDISEFGKIDSGELAHIYSICNKNGAKLSVTDLGATIVGLEVPDKNGNMRDVILGYDNAKEYQSHTFYFGACIGRNANRINKAVVELNNKNVSLEVNDNDNNLHSGTHGFHNVLWGVCSPEPNSIALTYLSKDGEQDFPGNMETKVTYTLTDDNELIIHYEAVSDKTTVANFTNHSYFNLNGHDSGNVYDQELMIKAQAYTPVIDAKAIPTGEIQSVDGTPFDFRGYKKIGLDIEADNTQIKYGNGCDHNFALDKNGHEMTLAGSARSAESGIQMDVYTDCVGMQFYSGNFIEKHQGKSGAMYDFRNGFCLETQYFPNAVSEPKFESPVINPGEKYDSITKYSFSLFI